MARKYVYHIQKIIPESESLTSKEIFGAGVKSEVRKAKKILKDFAEFYDSIKSDYDKIIATLNACTQSAQVASVMANIRRYYM